MKVYVKLVDSGYKFAGKTNVYKVVSMTQKLPSGNTGYTVYIDDGSNLSTNKARKEVLKELARLIPNIVADFSSKLVVISGEVKKCASFTNNVLQFKLSNEA